MAVVVRNPSKRHGAGTGIVRGRPNRQRFVMDGCVRQSLWYRETGLPLQNQVTSCCFRGFFDDRC
jgi:hypothetical protein